MTKIYHAINLSNYPTDSRLWDEQLCTIQSIEDYQYCSNVTVVAIGDGDMPVDIIPKGWIIRYLNRTACTERYDIRKNYPFIHDIMDILYKLSNSPDDMLMFTNSDCMVVKNTYIDVIDNALDFVALRRDNIWPNGTKLCHKYGIDGVAMGVEFWPKLKLEYGDYLLGALSWDTAIAITAERLSTNVVHNYSALLHRYHENAWDLDNPRPEDWHNINISYKMLVEVYGISKNELAPPRTMWGHKNIPKPWLRQYGYDDISVIMCIWSTNPEYVANAKKTILELRKQSEKFQLVFVEFIPSDAPSNFSDDPIDTHVIIRGFDDTHMDIFQKNVLWNIGAKNVSGNRKLIFMDCDIISHNKNWLMIIREKLNRHWNVVVQGFMYVHDNNEPMLCRYGAAYCILTNDDKPHKNPGLCYGMSKQYFHSMGGFNEVHGTSGVDTVFMAELGYLENMTLGIPKWLANNDGMNKMRSIVRDISTAMLDYAPVEIIHLSHGTFSQRRYGEKLWWRLNATRKKEDLFRLDHRGVLAWVDPYCGEREALKKILS